MDDPQDVTLMFEALFDIKAAVFEIREALLGEDDGDEEEEEDA